MRIAFFGGSFDPPHCGHVTIAKAARERLALDRILFAPAGQQPFKDTSSASFTDRLEMVRLAITGEQGFEASTIDGPRANGLPNYTFDVLLSLRSQLQPEDRLFLLVGADSFLDLPRWHRAPELLRLAEVVVATRPGSDIKDLTAGLPAGTSLGEEGAATDRIRTFPLHMVDGARSTLYLLTNLAENIAATNVRQALQEGEGSARGVLPDAVLQYIRQKGLYQAG